MAACAAVADQLPGGGRVRGKGITYDTGFFRRGAVASTREVFDPVVVRREMGVIREDLHCNSVTGSELSLFTVGFLPGDRLDDRLGLLATPGRLRELLAEVPARINDFLARAVGVVGGRFGGRISYASLPLEGVDWAAAFDVVATDAGYRSAELADRFRDDIRAFVARARAQGKPAAVTELGCTTHRGAADLGGRGDAIVEWDDDGRPRRLRGDHARDEAEQAAYLRELLEVFDAEGVDTVFVPHRSDPHQDLDMASYGVVKVLGDRRGHTYPDMAWEPKAAFTALADYYRG
jgi:hypothetical protein